MNDTKLKKLKDIGRVTITSKNMIVIPKAVRKKLRLKKGQKLRVYMKNREIIIVPMLTIDDLTGCLKGSKTSMELIRKSRIETSRFE